MTLGTVQGQVASRPQPEMDELGRQSFTSATALVLFFPDRSQSYENLFIRFIGVEKPDSTAFTPVLNVSTNGASLEGGVGGYIFSIANWTATAALVATGNSGANNFMQISTLNTAPFNLATATGIPGECLVYIAEPYRANRARIFAEWSFSNSASSPAHSISSGSFASGPIKGVALTHNLGTLFSGSVIAYGWGRRGP